MVPCEPAETRDTGEQVALARLITTALAPAAAIAVLLRAKGSSGTDVAALRPIVAGVKAAAKRSSLRIELLFRDGAILPFEIDKGAARALIAGLEEQLNDLERTPSMRTSRKGPKARE